MFKIILELNKIRIISAVVLSFLLGHVLSSESISFMSLIPSLGLLLIAGASAVLNQLQERKLDKLMPRTQNRPLPSGRISVTSVIFLILAEFIIGSFLLWYWGNFTAVLLAWLTMFWYNGIYTWLKRRSPLAIIPGSIIGALPPIIGWVSAGGNMFDTQIIFVAFFFFMWQIPHFWLLALIYNPDYKKAGFPTILDIYPKSFVKKLTFIYALGTAISAMFLSFFNIVDGLVESTLIIISSLGLIFIFYNLFRDDSKDIIHKKYFAFINLYLLLIMVFIFIDKLT